MSSKTLGLHNIDSEILLYNPPRSTCDQIVASVRVKFAWKHPRKSPSTFNGK